MTIAIALCMVVVAIILLSSDRVPIEVSSLVIVVLLVVSGLVTAEEALSGFSSDTAIFIFALLGMTQGLGATGVMQVVGRRLLYFAKFGPQAFVAVLLATVAAFSSVASNTAVAAAFLPVALSSSVQARVKPRALLMPLAFSSMLGGMIFLYGTSTNLVASAAMAQLGMQPIGFTELSAVGFPLALIGLATTLLLSRWLLKGRGATIEKELVGQRGYVTEIVLTAGSRLVGKPLHVLTDQLGIPVRGIAREGTMTSADPEERLRADDHLIISGSLEDILRVRDLRSVGFLADLRLPGGEDSPRMMFEFSIPPTSGLAGRSLAELRFSERYGVQLLAIDRHPRLQMLHPNLDLIDSLSKDEALQNLKLSVGDLLLLCGSEERLQKLTHDDDFTPLGGVEYQRPRYRRAPFAVAIFAAALGLAASGLLAASIAGLAGLLVMIVTGCVDARTAFRVDWRVPIMIGALLTLGLAMEKSGAGEFLAQGVIPLSGYIGPHGVLSVLMLGTILLSIPMSNQAAALLMIPIGVHAAADLGVDPRTFAIGTCLAASCSLLTPLEPSAALVYRPGRYSFGDFLKVGTPLTALLLFLLTILVPSVWPFEPG